MVARQQALTSSFARQLLAVRGSVVVLPEQDVDGTPIPSDQRTICGLFKPDRATVVDEHSNLTYQEYVLRIPPYPPYGLGALAAGMVVTIRDDEETARTYYVANVSPERLGWQMATLQEHS